MKKIVASFALLLSLSGCTGTTASTTTGGTTTGAKLSYSKDAESNYKLGMARMEDNLYQEAIRYFTYVKDRFPYSKYASLSELRIADAHFLAREYTDSVDQFKRFIRLHPSHEEVPYATFKIGESYYKQLPKDWFLMPPSYEKDLTAIEDALKSLEGYAKAFPEDKSIPQAKKLIAECKRKLANHELYVANFYQKKKKWPAVIGRLEGMRKSYLGLGFDEEVYAGLVRAYQKNKDQVKACERLAEFKVKVPNASEVSRLEAELGKCEVPTVPTNPALVPDPVSMPAPTTL
jgi:outer membrane protein assembly factor BamD